MSMVRHIGRTVSTGEVIALVFMQLPEDAGFALALPLETLPLAVGDHVQAVLHSPEGQSESILAEAMARRLVSPQRNLLWELRERGLLRRIPVDDVVMTPTPQQAIPLREILSHMLTAMRVPEAGETSEDKRTRYQINSDAQQAEAIRRQALNLITEAEDLEYVAAQKRRRALEIDPTLAPNAELGNIDDPAQKGFNEVDQTDVQQELKFETEDGK